MKNMNTDYKVGDFIYNADIYDGLNNSLSDLAFYKKWLPQNKDAKILELCFIVDFLHESKICQTALFSQELQLVPGFINFLS